MLPKDHLQYYCKAKEFFGPTNIFIRCRNVQAHALIKHSNSDLVGIQTNRVTRGYVTVNPDVQHHESCNLLVHLSELRIVAQIAHSTIYLYMSLS